MTITSVINSSSKIPSWFAIQTALASWELLPLFYFRNLRTPASRSWIQFHLINKYDWFFNLLNKMKHDRVRNEKGWLQGTQTNKKKNMPWRNTETMLYYYNTNDEQKMLNQTCSTTSKYWDSVEDSLLCVSEFHAARDRAINEVCPDRDEARHYRAKCRRRLVVWPQPELPPACRLYPYL